KWNHPSPVARSAYCERSALYPLLLPLLPLPGCSSSSRAGVPLSLKCEFEGRRVHSSTSSSSNTAKKKTR
uniref:Uncharacterized protein n=1 Tax=Anopheles quadriannulatus TaxID=34691 RepID=A0A182XTC7_ANOQN